MRWALLASRGDRRLVRATPSTTVLLDSDGVRGTEAERHGATRCTQRTGDHAEIGGQGRAHRALTARA